MTDQGARPTTPQEGRKRSLASVPRDSAPPASKRGIKPLVSLRAHKRAALATFLVVLLLGVPMAFLKGKPLYRAEAAILINPRFMKNLQEDMEVTLQSNSQYRQFVQQQVYTLKRYDIMLATLERLGTEVDAWRLPGETDRRAAERLMGAIVVTPVPDTYLVTISLDGETPEHLDDIVNTLIEVYLEIAQGEVLFGSDKRLHNLETHRQQLVGELERDRGEQTDIAEAIGVSTFEQNFVNPYDRLFESANTACYDARRTRIAAEAQLTAFESAMLRELTLSLDAETRDILAGDRTMGDVRTAASQRIAVLEEQKQGLEPANPIRQDAEAEIQAIRTRIAREEQEAFERIRVNLDEKRTTRLATEWSRQRAKLDETLQIEERFEKRLERVKQDAAFFATRYHRALELRSDVERLQNQLRVVDDRIDFLKLEESAPGFVRLSTAARQPEIPIQGGKSKFLMIFGVLALLGGLVVPIALDLFDKRVHSFADAQNLLGLVPMGWLVERKPAERDPFADDQLRRLALSLLREHEEVGTATFTFTGVRAGEGVTSTIFEIAARLRAYGVKALVLEADALAPRPEGRSKAGLGEILDRRTNALEALCETENGVPWIPVGRTFWKARGLVRSGSLPAFLQALRKRWDIVLIDAPPVLLSADTEFLATKTDATILVIAAEGAGPGEIRRAAHTLEKTDPTVFGVIVNRIRIYRGGGYFGDYVKTFRNAHADQDPSSELDEMAAATSGAVET